VVRMVVKVKTLPQMTYKVLVVIFNRLIEVIGPCPFRRTLLRGPSAYFSFNLNSIRYTIVKIKI
jgi:hypothetical protein